MTIKVIIHFRSICGIALDYWDESVDPGELYGEKTKAVRTDNLYTKRKIIQLVSKSKDCSKDKSLFSNEDIASLIDYSIETLSVYESLNKSYHLNAVNVREKHTESLKHFLEWFEDRPKHLMHVLEDIAHKRQQIEPIIKELAVSSDYAKLCQTFSTKSIIAENLLKRLSVLKKICALNCEANESVESFVLERRIQETGDNRICMAMADLSSEINKKINNLTAKFSLDLNVTVKDLIDHLYSEKIDNLKTKLKCNALKEYGKTMYDILTLQDFYYHYNEVLDKVDIKSKILNAKESAAQIDLKLIELERKIISLGVKCNNCKVEPKNLRIKPKSNDHSETWNTKVLSTFHSGDSSEFISTYIDLYNNTEDVEEYDDIDQTMEVTTDNNYSDIGEDSKMLITIDNLVIREFYKVSNRTEADLNNIFKELENMLLDINANNTFTIDPEQIEEHVKEMVEHEKRANDELSKMISNSSIDKMVVLFRNMTKLVIKINAEL